MKKYVILNGKLIEEDKANISVFNKAIFFDFGVYDSMKVVKKKLFFLDFHVDRLLQSAKILKLKHRFSKKEISEWIKLLIEKNDLENAMLRFLLLGAGGKDEEPKLFIFSVGLKFYHKRDYKKGIKVITYNGERRVPQAKSKDLLINFLALREAMDKAAKDALLVDADDFVREGTRTNFFAIKDSVLYTAPLSDVLEGVTRKIVVMVAKENNIKLIEKKIKLKELKEYDEFFITSTSMNILPITQIDDYVIEEGVGPITKFLIKAFKEYYDKEIFNK